MLVHEPQSPHKNWQTKTAQMVYNFGKNLPDLCLTVNHSFDGIRNRHILIVSTCACKLSLPPIYLVNWHTA